MIIKAILVIVLGWFLWRLSGVFTCYRDYHFYKKQNIKFTSDSFSLVSDVKRMIGHVKKYPTCLSWSQYFIDHFK